MRWTEKGRQYHNGLAAGCGLHPCCAFFQRTVRSSLPLMLPPSPPMDRFTQCKLLVLWFSSALALLGHGERAGAAYR